MLQQLIERISQIVSLSAEEEQCISAAFEEQHLKKGELWIQENKVCRHISFVASGRLRVFYNTEAGQETTCYFVGQGDFISSFTSFLTETPTTENIIAIEDSSLYSISKDELELLCRQVPQLHIWRRVIAENLFIMLEKRIATLQSRSADERYAKMMEEQPELILSVPLQYTASFLGITPQHLSRLRKDMLK